MIRTKSKIYGEVTNPDTVTSNAAIPAEQYVLGATVKLIKGFDPGPNTILISVGDDTGTVSALSFNGQMNKIIATNNEGNIVLLDRTT